MSYKTPDLLQDVQRQRLGLKQRIRQSSNVYAGDLAAFDTAAEALPEIARRTGAVQDLGSLTGYDSRNLVRRVALRDGTFGVLKVIGDCVEYGEGDVLDAWSSRGLPCVRPLAWGEHCDGPGASAVTYLLTPFVVARTMSDVRGKTLGDKTRQIRLLSDFLRPFHQSGATVARARTWEERMLMHIEHALPALKESRLRTPFGWQRSLRQLSTEGEVLLHGDPAVINILADDGGKPSLLIDPRGAVTGRAEADIGQICAQIGGPAHAFAMVGYAASLNPDHDPARIAQSTALCLMTYAGLAASGFTSADARVEPVPGVDVRTVRLRHAEALLDTASALLAGRSFQRSAIPSITR